MKVAAWLHRAAAWCSAPGGRQEVPCARALARMDLPALLALLSSDKARAAAWVGEAARQGIVAAQVRLGRMLLEGDGLARDPDAAFRWFATAARDGDADGTNMLGRCHEQGWGTVADLGKAAACYRKAAERGDSWAQYNLGHLLLDGCGVAQDHSEAFSWYSRAAFQGHPRAMNLTARCLEHGWGTVRDVRRALDFYRRSAEAGYFRGQYNYATLLLGAGQIDEARAWLLCAKDGAGTLLAARIETLLETAGTLPPALRVASRSSSSGLEAEVRCV